MNEKTQHRNIGKMGIAAIMLMSSLTVMVGNVIAPALPELGQVYGLGNYASWLVTAPALGVVATAIVSGRLIDKKGPYIVAFLGLLFYGIFGVAGAYMPNAVTLFIDRFLLGVATAAIMNASVALIASFFKGEKQLKIIAIQGMSMEFGGVIFFSVSGFLADISWRSPFFIYTLGILALLALVVFIPNNRVNNAQEAIEEQSDNKPKGVPLQLVLLIAFFGMLMFFTLIVSLPIYLQSDLGYSPTFTGNYLATLDLVAVLAAGIMPNIVKKFKPQGCLTIAFFLYATAFILYFTCAGNAVILWIAVIFAGLGFGFSTPLFNSLVVTKSTPEKKGINISFCTMAMFMGQFLSALLISFLTGKTLFITAGMIALVIAVCILPITKKFAGR